jgi:hypothetical protein
VGAYLGKDSFVTQVEAYLGKDSFVTLEGALADGFKVKV